MIVYNEFLDVLLRSRQTILDILEDRGYDTAQYRNIAPEQIKELIAGGDPRTLSIFVPRREGSAAPCERAVVLYYTNLSVRTKASTVLSEMLEMDDGTGSFKVDKTDDILILINEPLHETILRAGLTEWQENRMRVTFFNIKEVVVHLGRHVLVPPHRKMTADELKDEMTRLHITQKSQLPVIKYGDTQARLLGLVPGDAVEILRPSPTAGVERFIRICAA
jgi:DNA-directed RNA polymerase subunit H (RpoH/RPB5)